VLWSPAACPECGWSNEDLVDPIGSVLTGSGWLRSRTHFPNNLRAKTPKRAWPMVAGMLNSVFEQPDAESVHRQYRELCAALDGKFPDAVAPIESAETDVLAVSAFPVEHWKRIRSNNLLSAAEQGDPTAHRRRRNLPRPRRGHPPRRRRARRTTRGMGLCPPLYEGRIACQGPPHRHPWRRQPPRRGGEATTRPSELT
jgi:hypothetical protein